MVPVLAVSVLPTLSCPVTVGFADVRVSVWISWVDSNVQTVVPAELLPVTRILTVLPRSAATGA